MKIGIIMDPLSTLTVYKDSTVAIMVGAQARGHKLFFIEGNALFCENAKVLTQAQSLKIDEKSEPWFSLGGLETQPAEAFDLLLMRKDPPFDTEYLYATYLLSLAEEQGAKVLNSPSGIRSINEKLFTQRFPELIPTTLVTSSTQRLKAFIEEQNDVVLKPLNEMGGSSIFHLQKESDNCSVVLEWMTQNGKKSIMAQRFIPDILKTGDKRITLFGGKPVCNHALARIPTQGDFRGNLAAGGKGVAVPLTDRDYEICEKVGPILLEKGIVWAGLDVIGDYLTETNVTSPTGIRELDTQLGINTASIFWDHIETNA